MVNHGRGKHTWTLKTGEAVTNSTPGSASRACPVLDTGTGVHPAQLLTVSLRPPTWGHVFDLIRDLMTLAEIDLCGQLKHDPDRLPVQLAGRLRAQSTVTLRGLAQQKPAPRVEHGARSGSEQGAA